MTKTIDLHHGDEVALVIEALDYAAEDYAYRADFEERSTMGDPNEAREYHAAADRYSALAAALRKRAGIDPV